MRQTKRMISFLLALVLVLNIVPPAVVRAEETVDPVAVSTEPVTEPTVETTAPAVVSTEAETEPVVETTAPTVVSAETEPVVETTAPVETATGSGEATVEEPVFAEQETVLQADAADGEVKTGTWKQGMTWTMDPAGTLTISGSGIVGHPDSWYPITGNAWSGDGVVHLVLEEGITGIGEYVFHEIKTLETVTMPAGLVSVGNDAFKYCTALKTIHQKEGLTSLGSSAFYKCSSLEGILLGEGLEQIPYGTFKDCSSLKSVVLPASVVSVGEWAFGACYSLETVTFQEGLVTIAANAFISCGIKSLKLPESVTTVGDRAFSGHQVENLTLPESDISFGKEVFGSRSLKTVTLPETMTVIPQGMFFRCENLTTVNFPANLKTISKEAFSGCWSLTDIKLPEGLKEIGAEAFLNSNLKTVKFPKGIELIDGLAFSGCSNLKSFEVAEGEDYYSVMDGVLYRLDGKILHSFPAGKEYGTFVVPKGVQAIGNGAFSGAEADRIVLQEGVTDIGDNAFRGWTQSVVLPRSLKRIGTNAFIGNLKEVYYFGSEKDWAKIEIDDANYGLETATIHYGGVIESGTFGSDFRWELNAVGELVISGSGRMPDFDDYDDIPWMASRGSIVSVKIRKGITHISTNAFWDCPVLVRVTLPDTLKSVGNDAFSQCPKLGEQGTVVYQSTKEEYRNVSIGKNNDALKNAWMIFEYVSPYLDDQPIAINGPGKAYAYCSGQPYEEIAYRIGGVAGKATADQYGIIQIPLGSFTKSGFHNVSVEITQVGSRVLDPCQILEVTVEVMDYSFSQEWEGSVTAAAAAKIGPGFTCTPIGLEANLFALGGSASVGAISKVSRDRDEKTDTLTFTTEVKADVGGSVKSGITKKSHDVEFSFGGLSAGVKGGVSGSYGIEIENYKADNLKQQLAVGTYVLEQALTANPNSVLFMPVYAFLADTVYEETGCNVIYGSGFRGSASASADLLGLKVNGTEVIKGASGSGGVSVSFTEKHNNKGVDSKSSSYKTETELSVLSGDAPFNVVNEGLGVKMMGTDVSVGLKKSADSESLQISSLQGGSSALKLFIFGEYQKSRYVNYQFTDGSLESLKNYSRAIKTYVDGTNQIIGARDVADIANAVSSLYDPIAYTLQDQSEVVYSLPLDIAKACGIEDASLGITLSYKEGNGATTETGYAIHDQHRVVTQSNKKEPTSEEMWTLAQIYTNGLRAIADKVQTFLKKTWGNIKEGVADLRGWVTENVNAGVDWTISLFTFDIPGAKAQSYAIRTMNARGRALLSNGSNTQQLGSSTTIGQPLVVHVTESGTGEAVTDLSVEPLEFTIRYFEEDLSAAGLSKNDAIVKDGGIAMYRYIEDGDYYVCVGGTNDLEAMTVTAEITSPGQYVLAVDACAPTLKYLDMSDFRETPTITAYIDDLSGLSGKDFRFCIDGVEKVNGNNLSDHYNIAAGIFTYTVPEAEKLSEGEHTLSFTLGDTSENVDTYEYSFQVDLTAPVISSVYVSGQADKDASVWIESKVNDPNLNLVGVYACISEQQPDGSWGQEVLMDMDYVISDLYTLSYKANGHTIRISVRAVDKAQNQTDSDAVEVRSTKGDVNKDGTIDSQDALYLLWHALFKEDYPLCAEADFNHDTVTDGEDAEYLMWHILFPNMYPLN